MLCFKILEKKNDYSIKKILFLKHVSQDNHKNDLILQTKERDGEEGEKLIGEREEESGAKLLLEQQRMNLPDLFRPGYLPIFVIKSIN